VSDLLRLEHGQRKKELRSEGGGGGGGTMVVEVTMAVIAAAPSAKRELLSCVRHMAFVIFAYSFFFLIWRHWGLNTC
jgi:hypothetical protein